MYIIVRYIYMHDYTVISTAILCLWNIQLTFDWVGIEPHGAYPRKSDLNRCKRAQEI